MTTVADLKRKFVAGIMARGSSPLVESFRKQMNSCLLKAAMNNAVERYRWVTIGGKSKGDSEHSGGFPVELDADGNIIKSGGPQSIVGKHITASADTLWHERVETKRKENAAKSIAADREIKVGSRGSWKQTVKEQSVARKMSPDEYEAIADDVWKETLDHHNEREAAKEYARKLIGKNAGDIERMENNGKDYTNIKGADIWAEQVARQYPGIFNSEEPEQEFWDLIKEGKQPAPSKNSAEFLAAVEDYLGPIGSRAKRDTRTKEQQIADSEHFSKASEISAAAELTASPTEAQKEAGNYRKGKVNLHGLNISIENAKGSIRKEGWDPLAHHYGYILGTEGRDGDHLDCFIGPSPNSELVFVIDQVTAGGKFDEHKIMMGFRTEADAIKGYLANYPPGWKLGNVTAMTLPQFKAWIDSGDTSKPLQKQVSKYNRAISDEMVAKVLRYSAMQNNDKTIADKLPGGLADDKTPGDFDPEKLAAGIEVEMEHTSDEDIAREIAMDHLTEDPDYYDKLRKVEQYKREMVDTVIRYAKVPWKNGSKPVADESKSE